MVVIAIQVNSERLQAALADIQRGLGAPRPLMARLGTTLFHELRGHFLARDKEGNRHGWPTRHFWSREVQQKMGRPEVTDSGAVIRIASPPLAHKITGGTIRGKRASRFGGVVKLAIPATQEAYRAGSPREGGIKDLFCPKGRSFLMVKGGRVHYWLVESVTQAPDPRALPDMTAVGARLAAEAEVWVAKLRARA